MPAERLERTFFARDAATVAKALIGQTLVMRLPVANTSALDDDERVEHRARIVESEAYVGVHDLACHASKGRTKRTEIMFGLAGHAYVYLIYGIHELLNVVTGVEGDGEAVLLRAAEPLTSLANGGFQRGHPLRGPGKLTRSLGVTRALNGHDVCRSAYDASSVLWFEKAISPEKLGVSARIGVDYAGPWRDAPLRFFDPQSRAVSGPRRLPER
jgi:DNA-3-methyladenine glycosylase